VSKEVYTIVLFPGSTGAPKKFRITKMWAKIAIVFAIVLGLGITGSSYHFSQQVAKWGNKDIELADLRRETRLQKVQIEKFSHQVRTIENEMARLERFEKKLKLITAYEGAAGNTKKKWGVGGPYGLNSASFITSLQEQSRSMTDRLSGDLGSLTNQAKMKQVSFQEMDEYFKSQKSLLSATPSIWPTRGWLTSGFGYRKSPFTGLSEKHDGWDIAARSGANIRAPGDGTVVLIGRQNGYGNLLEIDHGYGLITRFAHTSKTLVKVGDKIKRGQVVALVGSTGRSTGPHLHYEVHLNGVPVNPRNYILED
jgi:murein DD-endopeptidase MepM/ murein hydrolase activator NlpD